MGARCRLRARRKGELVLYCRKPLHDAEGTTTSHPRRQGPEQFSAPSAHGAPGSI